MKVVYIKKHITTLYLKDGSQMEVNLWDGSWVGRRVYCYGELPEPIHYTIDAFDQFISQYQLHMQHTIFKRRKYINYSAIGRKIYEEDFEKITVDILFEVIDNPINEYLKQDLQFNEYSELIFNREQELKSMLLQ